MLNLTEEQKKQILKIGDKYYLKLILLHGSYATGRQNKESDVDIAVYSDKSLTSKQRSGVYSGLEDILISDLNRELDFKTINGADPFFIYKISQDAILLYGKESDFNEFKAYAYKIYNDSKDLRLLEKKMIDKYQSYLNHNYA